MGRVKVIRAHQLCPSEAQISIKICLESKFPEFILSLSREIVAFL